MKRSDKAWYLVTAILVKTDGDASMTTRVHVQIQYEREDQIHADYRMALSIGSPYTLLSFKTERIPYNVLSDIAQWHKEGEPITWKK